jgi:hypothetical protein
MSNLVPFTEPQDQPVPVTPLLSERVIVAAPFSFTGSAQRIWLWTQPSRQGWPQVGMVTLAVLAIACAWTFILYWYLIFGLLVVPYRLIRRGQRKDQRQALQHREMLAAVEAAKR